MLMPSTAKLSLLCEATVAIPFADTCEQRVIPRSPIRYRPWFDALQALWLSWKQAVVFSERIHLEIDGEIGMRTTKVNPSVNSGWHCVRNRNSKRISTKTFLAYLAAWLMSSRQWLRRMS